MYSFGQNTFNRVYQREFNYQLANIWVTQENYFTLGTVVDTSDFGVVFPKLVMSRYSKYGDIEVSKSYGSPDVPFIQTFDMSDFDSNQNMVFTCQGFYQGVQSATLFWVNENCDTIKTIRYNSPYDNITPGGTNEFIAPTDLAISETGDIYMSCNISHESEGNDCLLVKFNSDGELIWERIIESEFEDDSRTLYIKNESIYFGYSQKHYNGPTPQFHDNTVHLIEFNEEGQILSEFNSAEIVDNASTISNLIYANDSYYIVGSETSNENDINDPMLISIDENYNLNWISSFETHESILNSYFSIIVDTNGDLICSTIDIEEIEFDSLNGSFNFNTVLVRISSDGQILWKRNFSFINSLDDKHVAKDLEPTLDGGLIFAGYATDWNTDVNYDGGRQMGWLVKLDACGCLIPGCDPNCTTNTEITDNGDPFVIGPNPVMSGESLNIHYFQSDDDTPMVFSVYDLQGKLVSSFNARTSDTTYIMPLTDISAGTYVISMQRDGELIHQERFVVLN